MKKLLLSLTVLCSVSLTAQTKNYRLGANIGIPTGNVADVASFNFGVDVAYILWKPLESLNIGVSTGYSHFIGKNLSGNFSLTSSPNFEGYNYKSDEVEDFRFIPVAASVEFTLVKKLYTAADVGIAVGISKGNKTGFYFRPKLGWDGNSFQTFLYYSQITQEYAGISSFGLGGTFKF